MSDLEYHIWAPRDLWFSVQQTIHDDFPDYMQDYLEDWEFEEHNLIEWAVARKMFANDIAPWIAENQQKLMTDVREGNEGYITLTIHGHPLVARKIVVRRQDHWMKIGWIRFENDADAVKFKLQMERFRLTPTEAMLLKD